jgi:hypothetical protein
MSSSNLEKNNPDQQNSNILNYKTLTNDDSHLFITRIMNSLARGFNLVEPKFLNKFMIAIIQAFSSVIFNNVLGNF